MSHNFIIKGAGHGSLTLKAGERFRIINTHGSQVVDLWAFTAEDNTQYLSCEHTRSTLQKLIPEVGDALFTNLRHPILRITADSSPGIHDMLLSACDPRRYELLGDDSGHLNCADNLREAMAEKGHVLEDVPSPFNVFENVQIDAKGGLSIQPPLVSAGEYIELSAEMDCLVVMSCCPMDIALTNGPDKTSKPVEIRKVS